MGKKEQVSEPTSAPEVDQDKINLDIDDVDSDTKIEPTQTIEQAEAAAQPEISSDDEAIYKEAALEVAKDDPKPPVIKKKRGKKLSIIMVLLLLIMGGVAVAWYLLIKQKEQTITTSQEPTTTIDTTVTIGYEPDIISYAFRESDDLPETIYYRPFAGGERKQAQKVNRGETIVDYDTLGQTVVYATDSNIYSSKDGGRSFTSIVDLSVGNEVISIKISNESTKFAVATSAGDKTTVKSYGLDGKNETELLTTDRNDTTLQAWSEDGSKLIYTDGCNGCDNTLSGIRSVNLKDKKVSNVLESVDTAVISNLAISSDLSKLVFAQGVKDDTSTKAPYKVQLLDIESGKISDIATLGTAGEKNPNGTDKKRVILVGFLAGTTTPYYTNDATLYSVKDGESSSVYESDSQILSVSYVSETSLIVSTGASESDYILANFDVASGESTTIFQGDANTTIFGVSTK